MRLLYGIAILLVVIVLFAGYLYSHTAKISEGILESLNRLEQKVEEEKWEEASVEVENLKENWQEADALWTPLMDHREIDLLDQSIIKVIRLVQVRHKEDLLVEIDVAKGLVRRIRDKERPDTKNVF